MICKVGGLIFEVAHSCTRTGFCGLVLITVAIDDIRSKYSPFDWLMAKWWVGCLQEAFNVYNTFVIHKTSPLIQFPEFYSILNLSWLPTTKDFKLIQILWQNNKNTGFNGFP